MGISVFLTLSKVYIYREPTARLILLFKVNLVDHIMYFSRLSILPKVHKNFIVLTLQLGHRDVTYFMSTIFRYKG